MFREKTIIKLRKEAVTAGSYWKLRMGKTVRYPTMGISRLFRLIATAIQDKGKVYSIDIIVKRRR